MEFGWGVKAEDVQALHPKASKLVQRELVQTFTSSVYFQGFSIPEHCPLEMGRKDPTRLPTSHFVLITLANGGLMKAARGKVSTFSTTLDRILVCVILRTCRVTLQ